MPAPLLTRLVVGLLIALAEAAQQDSGIVDGWVAEPHSRPYMVSFQHNCKHVCGGFLVSRFFVMTAAHCWKKGKRLTVLLGAHDIKRKLGAITAEVKGYYIHPKFNKGTPDNDIMLLQLKTAVKKTENVQWIPLPKKDEDIKPKTICSVAGWGATTTKGPLSPRLREVSVAVENRTVCNKTWQGHVTRRMMCAGGDKETGFCQGDSGGPLVCHGKAVGIVSFNLDKICDYPNLPNVYTQISKFLPWINKYIKHIS